ncbi:MAG: condensation domain-containing protein, partial [Thioalkalispiraceae bacterium]
MDIAGFVYEVNQHGFYLWVESGKLKYRQFKECEDKSYIFEKISSNKKEIIQFLEMNQVFDDSLQGAVIHQQHIYKTDSKRQVLSFAQERLWFIELFEEGTSAYNIPIIFEAGTKLDKKCLELALRAVIHRHEALRTVIFENEEGEYHQEVIDDVAQPTCISTFSVSSKEELDSRLYHDAHYLFDLKNEFPIRICFYEISEQPDLFYVSIVVHHIAFDGWSMDIFMKELGLYYSGFLNNEKPSLDNDKIQYKDYALWQKYILSGENLEKEMGYWRDKLSGYENLQIITDYPRPENIDYAGTNVSFEMDPETSASLRGLAKYLNISLYSLLLSAYFLLLRAWTNQDVILVGSPSASRNIHDLESIVGFFINMIVMRYDFDGDMLLVDYINAIAEEVRSSQAHDTMPFEKIVNEIDLVKDTSRNSIFQAEFDVQGFGHGVYIESGDSVHKSIINTEHLRSYSPQQDINDASIYDLSFLVNDNQDALHGYVIYATKLFKQSTVERFASSFVTVLIQYSQAYKKIKQAKDVFLSDIRYLNQIEENRILYDWNQTTHAYHADQTLSQLFEEQVTATPDATALV